MGHTVPPAFYRRQGHAARQAGLGGVSDRLTCHRLGLRKHRWPRPSGKPSPSPKQTHYFISANRSLTSAECSFHHCSNLSMSNTSVNCFILRLSAFISFRVFIRLVIYPKESNALQVTLRLLSVRATCRRLSGTPFSGR
jgi:hypothetical protein